MQDIQRDVEQLSLLGNASVTVQSLSGDTLYYDFQAQVSASANAGSLSAGQSATFLETVWVVSASRTSVNVTWGGSAGGVAQLGTDGKIGGPSGSPLASHVVDSASAGSGQAPVADGAGNYAWGAVQLAPAIVTASGSASALALLSGQQKQVLLTLSANHTATITPAVGPGAEYFVTQPGAGGPYTFTISDGTTSQPVTLNPAANSLTKVVVESPDGVNLDVTALGGAGQSGLTTVEIAGVAQTARPRVNFVTGVTAADNAGNNSTDLTVTAGSPTGSAGGELAGTYPNPTIADQAVIPRRLADSARLPWANTGVIARTFNQAAVTVNIATIALTSGTLKLSGGVSIPGGRTITNIVCYSGSTAAATSTHCWFCLVDRNLNVLAKTVDDTAASPWAANTRKLLALSATYTPSSNTEVYIGVVVVATTVPSLAGLGAPQTPYAQLAVSGYSTTALTDPTSLGGTAAALSQTSTSTPQAYAELT